MEQFFFASLEDDITHVDKRTKVVETPFPGMELLDEQFDLNPSTLLGLDLNEEALDLSSGMAMNTSFGNLENPHGLMLADTHQSSVPNPEVIQHTTAAPPLQTNPIVVKSSQSSLSTSTFGNRSPLQFSSPSASPTPIPSPSTPSTLDELNKFSSLMKQEINPYSVVPPFVQKKEELANRQKQLESSLNEILNFYESLGLFSPGTSLLSAQAREALNRVLLTLSQLKTQLMQLQSEYAVIQQQQVLEPQYLAFFHTFQLVTLLLLKQTELLMSEVQNWLQNGNHKGFFFLVLTKQPPKYVKQSTKLNAPISVRLLISSGRVKFQRAGDVIAHLFYDDFKSSSELQVENPKGTQLEPSDPTLSSHFLEIRFPKGTRNRLVRLRFSVEISYVSLVDGVVKMGTGESDSSQAFVILTNESQWEAVEAMLLFRDCFSDNKSSHVSWSQFCNVLQDHYLFATRQPLEEIRRPLSLEDLNYIRNALFGGEDRVHQQRFKGFWEFFGPILHDLRHVRHITRLWLGGLICGFMSRTDAERMLAEEEDKTFLLRFSERKPGQFAIAFSTREVGAASTNEGGGGARKVVKHYLVKHEDSSCGGGKLFADFLREKENLQILLQWNVNFLANGRLVVTKHWKNEVLKEYYSGKAEEPVDGYEEEI